MYDLNNCCVGRHNGVQWSIVANVDEKCNGMSVVTTIVHTAHYIAIYLEKQN